MTTGQRWAKIASSGDDELITTQEQVEAMRSGNYGGGGGGGEPGTSSSLIVPEPKPPPTFDYDLMYRTYLRIPSAVRPPLPDRDALSDEDWEAAMKQIWEDRQKTLKEAMENIVDVPDVLQEMINKIANSSSPPTPTPTHVEDLIFELGELEYLLSDLDVARKPAAEALPHLAARLLDQRLRRGEGENGAKRQCKARWRFRPERSRGATLGQSHLFSNRPPTQ